ncbi:MAG: sugar ABC transporter ATP-binding protein [Anaerolineae bacterium]|nr:sugar ABC transporter ATP-binding protein [Anaerolineae bacterium]
MHTCAFRVVSIYENRSGALVSDDVLQMNRIDKSFFGVKILDSVTFQVRRGEVHALVGENGAGKSSLMKILMGIYTSDRGEIILDGQRVAFHHPREAIAHGVSMIHQELMPVMDMEVAENIFLGREIAARQAGLLGLVNKKEQRLQTAKLFAKMGISIDPKRLMRSLSVAQMQLVEIVKALSLSAKVVIMDEPTSAITDKEVDTLFDQIAKLKAQGVAIIYISHKIDEIFKIADRITVLRDGQLIATEDAASLNKDRLITMMVGREIKEFYPKETVQPGEVVLQVKELSQKGKFHDISFSVRRGEIVGIAGLVGAGRSELVECIFGITRPTSGAVLLDGKKASIRHPKDAIRSRMALVTEDRKLTGLNLKASVEHNISLVGIQSLSKYGIINTRKEAAVTEEYIRRMRIKVFSRKSMVNALSGGNQQKVVLSKWLLTEPEIIILDEPTRGIDVGAKRDIYLFMGELAKAGKAILMISSEIPELMGLSDRILVMAAGRLAGELERKDFSQENIMRLASKFEANKDE